MRRTLILKPAAKKRGANKQSFQFCYTYKGKDRVLNPDMTFTNHPQGNRPKVQSILFGPAKPFHKFEYEDGADGIKQSAEDLRIQKLHEDYLANHPLIWFDNMPKEFNSKKIPMFLLIDEQNKVEYEVNEWETKLNAINLVHSMDLEQLRNVCYYFGISPAKLTEKELKLKLAGLESGHVIQDEHLKDFLEHYGDNSKRTDTKIIETVNKAIEMMIVTKHRAGNVTNYYIGDEIVGATPDQVVAFMKTHPTVYEANVVRLVKEQEDFKEEKEKTKQQSKAKKVKIDPELDALRQEVTELKEKGLLPARLPVHLAMRPKLEEWRDQAHAKIDAKNEELTTT